VANPPELEDVINGRIKNYWGGSTSNKDFQTIYIEGNPKTN